MVPFAGIWGAGAADAPRLRFTETLDERGIPGGRLWAAAPYGDPLRSAGVVATPRRITLWSDLTGACPLFYARRRDGTVGFASEAKALFGWHAPLELRGDPSRRPLPKEGESNFAGVAAVAPGTAVTLSCGSASVVQFATLPSPVVVEQGQAVELVHEALTQSVTSAVAGMSRVSVALSGGVDSTTMAALARARVDTMDAWTVGTERCNEFDQAEEAATLLGASHHCLTMTADDVASLVPEMIWSLETWDPPTLEILAPLAFLYRELSRLGRHELLLLGYGADIVFGGQVNRDLDENGVEQALLHQARMTAPTNELSPALPSRWGIRLRYPYWTAPVLCVGLSIRARLKIRDGAVKHVLRKVAEQYLPAHVAWRPKRGIHVGAGTTGLLGEVLASDDRVTQRRRLREIAEDVFTGSAVPSPPLVRT